MKKYRVLPTENRNIDGTVYMSFDVILEEKTKDVEGFAWICECSKAKIAYKIARLLNDDLKAHPENSR
jgi:hypothetical protein